MIGSYATVPEVLDTYPLIGSVTTVDSAYVTDAVWREQARIDAILSQRYSVPFENVPPLVHAATIDLAVYRILATRLYPAEQLRDSPWPDRYKEMLDLIERVAKGEANLVTGSGTVLSADTGQSEIWSDTYTFTPTFHEGEWETMAVDTEKPGVA